MIQLAEAAPVLTMHSVAQVVRAPELESAVCHAPL